METSVSMRVASFYINNYFTQRASFWSCTWTEWTQDDIIQDDVESGRAEAWPKFAKLYVLVKAF